MRYLMKKFLISLIIVSFAGFVKAQPTVKRLEHVSIVKLKDRFSFVSPEGNPFIAIGIAHANMPPESRRGPGDATLKLFKNDEERFNTERDKWLRNTGFNTFSYTKPAKNGNQFYWIETLNLFPGFINKGSQCPDLFSDSFRNASLEQIRKIVPDIAKDKYLLGISLGLPVLASPHQMPTRTWQRRNEKPVNYLYHIQSLNKPSQGKRKYIAYLEKRFINAGDYCLKRKWKSVKQWSDLLDADLSVFENPFYLHPDDEDFYKKMWSEVIELFAKEVKRLAPGKIVFAPRLIGLGNFPDNWLDAWFKAVGPHVHAFIPEIYGDNDYTAVINRIGELTGKPSFIGDGMRPREFNYTSSTTDESESVIYERMFHSLIRSPWFLGSTICEYHTKLPAYPWYAERLKEGRLGIRNADYSDRKLLIETYKKLHSKLNIN